MRELELLQRIYARHAQWGGAPGRVLIPPGDDMCLLENPGSRVLTAVDQVVEGRHFLPGTDPAAVGRKAMLRNLSDVAAMAAEPWAALATVVFPPGFTQEEAQRLHTGLWETAREWNCPLAGGDIAVHAAAGAPLVVTVTILALPGPTGRVIERAGAREGDLLCVTGSLGGSYDKATGGGRHLEFTPRIRHAQELVRLLGDRLHAMIDLSDGLGRDAAHLARAAGLDVEIPGERLPCSAGAGWRNALSDGEDYELAFACDGNAGGVPEKVLGVPVTVVGKFVPAGGISGASGGGCRVFADGQWHDAAGMGWAHDG